MRGWLLAAGILDAVAALLHAACIIGGSAWYRFFGAGEGMARAAERGLLRPTLITLAITCVLAAWAAFAFSGAGMLPPFPLLRPALFAIATVLLLRATALPVMLRTMPDRGTSFLWISSVIVLALGLIHLIGALTLRTD